MKNRYSLGLNFSFYFKSALLAVLITLAQQAFANVGVTLNLWRGYDTFYGQVTIAASSPDPVTYHRVESPNGKIWREYSTTTSVGSFTNLSFSVLLDECTNGVWTLIRNVGDTSAQTNTFSVSLTGITANMFGDITMVDPLYNEVASTNPPELQWSSTSMFPEIAVSVRESNAPYTFGDYAVLPGTATSWTPSAALTIADQLLLIQYQTNHFPGASFSLISGPAIAGWNPSASLMSYLYSVFAIPGGGSELDIAVESPGLSWITGGDWGGDGWFVQSDIIAVGTSALQSGAVPDDTSSWIETTVHGPGSLYFEWNMLADDYDVFEFSAVDEHNNHFDGF
ncbi:MAG: hypothetical protein PHO37_04410 [Kiritimatiellae bacterium]|nr:hypothetical protein [Kiritimatiellia bacterium]